MAPVALVDPDSSPSITDRIAPGALTSTFLPELSDQVVAQTSRTEQRRWLLPTRLVVYFVLSLGAASPCGLRGG